jgi:hypothetical protein
MPPSVQANCKLHELGRGIDDSTGLRSDTTLNTPRTRCESRANGRLYSRSRRDTVKIETKGLDYVEAFVLDPRRNIRRQPEWRHAGARKEGEESRREGAGRKKIRSVSAPKTGLEHVNDSVLPCDHLSLPHENDRHYAHRKNTKRQDDPRLCFRCRYVEHSPKNFHKGRPPKGNCRVYSQQKEVASYVLSRAIP